MHPVLLGGLNEGVAGGEVLGEVAIEVAGRQVLEPQPVALGDLPLDVGPTLHKYGCHIRASQHPPHLREVTVRNHPEINNVN